MKPREIIQTLFATAFAALMIAVPVTAYAAAECGDIPQLKAWGGMTNARVERYVDRKLKGDWQPYVDHLAAQLESVKTIQASGASAKIRYKDKSIKLTGKTLDSYVKASEKRYQVVSCLADQATGVLAASLNDFSTAAGGATDEASEQEISTDKGVPELQKSAIPAGALKLNIATSCENGNAIFKVTNRGGAWPKSSTFGIYRMGSGDKQVVSSRRMRLKANQTSTFRIKASKNPTGQLGLFVDPSWYKRGFDYDATVRCR